MNIDFTERFSFAKYWGQLNGNHSNSHICTKILRLRDIYDLKLGKRKEGGITAILVPKAQVLSNS
jgi:hypothetical protein